MDLIDHRAALVKAIHGQELYPVAMENDSAKPDVDVIDSSLQMVRNASAYIGVISYKYGQIPESPERNPNRLSLTELEFNEAQRLERPVLLFIMGDNHYVKHSDVERDGEKMDKLEAFRENAKRLKSDSSVHRIYKVFNDLNEFQVAATQAIAGLRRYLDKQDNLATPQPQGKFPSRSLNTETESEPLRGKDEMWSKLEYLFGESKLTLLFEDITRSKDHVIVSSDGYDLTAKGGVSNDIRSAGGEAITKDANKMVPLTLGQVIPTTAGDLPARFIFHAITIGPDPTDKYAGSRKKPLTRELTKKCMHLLMTLNLESISFPALGTGYAQFPLKLSEVASEMIQTISNYMRLRKINATIYLYNPESKLDPKKIFEEVVSSTPNFEKNLVSSSLTLSDIALPNSPPTVK